MAKSHFRVLIVEDDEALRTLYTEAFEHNQFVVIQAEDGQLGVDYAVQQRPDAIVLDLLLPRQGGLRALRILRTLPETKNTPVVIMTAMPNPEYQEMAKGKVQGYFLKTQTKPQELVDSVKALLDERH